MLGPGWLSWLDLVKDTAIFQESRSLEVKDTKKCRENVSVYVSRVDDTDSRARWFSETTNYAQFGEVVYEPMIFEIWKKVEETKGSENPR